MDTHIVIMAGGIGSRLWPVSTPALPKQFIDVLGVGKSLLQLTVERFLPVTDISRFWVVTSAAYVDTVRTQLPEVPVDQILAEPVGRNTAPCIAYACWKIRERYPDADVVVTPADALVLKTDAFASVISKAVQAVHGTPRIVTVGIRPTRPETGYGYIFSSSTEEGKVVKVNAFKEKPSLPVAEGYYADGRYFWNAGIFVWNVATVIREISAHAPQIAGIMEQLRPSFYTPSEPAALQELFPQCDKISIDYAVMEKSSEIYTIAADLGWSDLGTWASLGQHIPADAACNSVVGEGVRLFDCEGCIVHADGPQQVVVQGLTDYIVAARDGKVLVCSLAQEQHIKEYTA